MDKKSRYAHFGRGGQSLALTPALDQHNTTTTLLPCRTSTEQSSSAHSQPPGSLSNTPETFFLAPTTPRSTHKSSLIHTSQYHGPASSPVIVYSVCLIQFHNVCVLTFPPAVNHGKPVFSPHQKTFGLKLRTSPPQRAWNSKTCTYGESC